MPPPIGGNEWVLSHSMSQPGSRGFPFPCVHRRVGWPSLSCQSSSHTSWPAHHCSCPACWDISATQPSSHTCCSRAVNIGGKAGSLWSLNLTAPKCAVPNWARAWRAAWGETGEHQGTDDGGRSTGGFKQVGGALRASCPGYNKDGEH